MRCFIHTDVEATAVCKTCGKAMCMDCSSYSGHSGICPECRCEEFKEELSYLEDQQNGSYAEARTAKIMMVIDFVIAGIFVVLGIAVHWFMFVITAVFAILGLVKLSASNKAQKAGDEKKPRIDYLKKEISKIQSALANGSGII